MRRRLKISLRRRPLRLITPSFRVRNETRIPIKSCPNPTPSPVYSSSASNEPCLVCISSPISFFLFRILLVLKVLIPVWGTIGLILIFLWSAEACFNWFFSFSSFPRSQSAGLCLSFVLFLRLFGYMVIRVRNSFDSWFDVFWLQFHPQVLLNFFRILFAISKRSPYCCLFSWNCSYLGSAWGCFGTGFLVSLCLNWSCRCFCWTSFVFQVYGYTVIWFTNSFESLACFSLGFHTLSSETFFVFVVLNLFIPLACVYWSHFVGIRVRLKHIVWSWLFKLGTLFEMKLQVWNLVCFSIVIGWVRIDGLEPKKHHYFK